MSLADEYALAYACLAIRGELGDLTETSNADDMVRLLRGEKFVRGDFVLQQAHAITRVFGVPVEILARRVEAGLTTDEQERANVDALVHKALSGGPRSVG